MSLTSYHPLSRYFSSKPRGNHRTSVTGRFAKLAKLKEPSKRKNLSETEKKIVSILDEYIQPAVASDGGSIVFESYVSKNKSVNVILQGACSGCPSSTFTLKNGIENMLREMMPNEVESVNAING